MFTIQVLYKFEHWTSLFVLCKMPGYDKCTILCRHINFALSLQKHFCGKKKSWCRRISTSEKLTISSFLRTHFVFHACSRTRNASMFRCKISRKNQTPSPAHEIITALAPVRSTLPSAIPSFWIHDFASNSRCPRSLSVMSDRRWSHLFHACFGFERTSTGHFLASK